jgi:hypothetical protein
MISIAHSGHFVVPAEDGNAVKGLADQTEKRVWQSMAKTS